MTKQSDFIIHSVEQREVDGKKRFRISYERRSEWKPKTVYLDELLDELDNRDKQND